MPRANISRCEELAGENRGNLIGAKAFISEMPLANKEEFDALIFIANQSHLVEDRKVMTQQ